MKVNAQGYKSIHDVWALEQFPVAEVCFHTQSMSHPTK